MLKQLVGISLLVATLGGCGGSWVYFNPPPLKHAHYYWKQGVRQGGGCRFTTNLNQGQEEEEIKVNPSTCLGYFERGDARPGG